MQFRGTGWADALSLSPIPQAGRIIEAGTVNSMVKVAPFGSCAGKVIYHDETRCVIGRRIAPDELAPMIEGRVRCAVCESLRSKIPSTGQSYRA